MNEETKESGLESAREGQGIETKAEDETVFIKAAEMLETPKDGSFLQGLQTFIAWVKSLVAPKDQP